jgi:anti-anti-sigma factor
MDMAEVCADWDVAVERGPDWLFVRLHPGSFEPEHVGEKVWSLADRHFIYRVVLEMEDVEMLPSWLIGQLVVLQKRLLQRGGAMRLCALNDNCAEALHFCRLDQALPTYECREDAVKGLRSHAVH